MVSQDNNMRRRQQITITSVPLPRPPPPPRTQKGGRMRVPIFRERGYY